MVSVKTDFTGTAACGAKLPFAGMSVAACHAVVDGFAKMNRAEFDEQVADLVGRLVARRSRARSPRRRVG